MMTASSSNMSGFGCLTRAGEVRRRVDDLRGQMSPIVPNCPQLSPNVPNLGVACRCCQLAGIASLGLLGAPHGPQPRPWPACPLGSCPEPAQSPQRSIANLDRQENRCRNALAAERTAWGPNGVVPQRVVDWADRVKELEPAEAGHSLGDGGGHGVHVLFDLETLVEVITLHAQRSVKGTDGGGDAVGAPDRTMAGERLTPEDS